MKITSFVLEKLLEPINLKILQNFQFFYLSINDIIKYFQNIIIVQISIIQRFITVVGRLQNSSYFLTVFIQIDYSIHFFLIQIPELWKLFCYSYDHMRQLKAYTKLLSDANCLQPRNSYWLLLAKSVHDFVYASSFLCRGFRHYSKVNGPLQVK